MWSNRKHMRVTQDKQMQSCVGYWELSVCETEPSQRCYSACQELKSLGGNDSSTLAGCQTRARTHTPFSLLNICTVMPMCSSIYTHYSTPAERGRLCDNATNVRLFKSLFWNVPQQMFEWRCRWESDRVSLSGIIGWCFCVPMRSGV